MLCEPFGDHYNGFPFVFIDFCCHRPEQSKRGKEGVWFLRNIPISLAIYARGKKVWCLISKHTWNFLKLVSVQFPLDSLIEVSKKICLSILCFRNVWSWSHIFYDVHHTHSYFAILLENSALIPPLLFT